MTNRPQPSITIPVATLADGASRRALLDTLVPLASLAGPARIVLDLARVDRIDAEGVATLLACRRAVCDNGGTLDLLRISPQLRVLLELCRLHHVFPGVHAATVAAPRRRKAGARLEDRGLAS